MMGLLLPGTPARSVEPFPMKYVDEIGHMDSDIWGDHRKSVNLSDLATASVQADDKLRIEGKDDDGKPWTLVLPRIAGVGGTPV